MANQYYIIDSIRNGDCSGGDEPLEAATEEVAIATARTAWDALPDFEKAKRESFTLVEASDADGITDTGCARVICEYVSGDCSKVIQTAEIPMTTFKYRITGERAEEAAAEMERRIDIIEHERDCGQLGEEEYLTDLDEIPKDAEKEFSVTVRETL